jgi:hypothetical protein
MPKLFGGPHDKLRKLRHVLPMFSVSQNDNQHVSEEEEEKN